MKTAEQTKVIYRTFKSGGDVIALFPEVPFDAVGDFCESYQHVGQHGAASPVLTASTRAALPGEIEPLRKELERLGYNLKPYRRVSFEMHKKRRESARR